MSRRSIGIVLLVLGIVLVLAGAILMFVFVPGMKQFPDDVDTTRRYEGTMPVLLNPSTFEFMTDLEVDLERHFETEEVDGDVALVLEQQTLSDKDGNPLQVITKRYAIDRKTMEFADDYPDSWAEKEGFWVREGLVLGWPIGTEKKEYTGWSDDYRATVALAFDKEEKIADIDTYLFTASQPPAPIDPAAAAAMGLPPALPKEQLAALIESADISPVVKSQLPGLLEEWPEDTIPLAYYYEYEGWYWVEPVTGVLIDTKKHELRKVGLADEVLEAAPLLAAMDEEQRALLRIAVSDLTYQGIEDSVEDAKQDAVDAKNQLDLFGTFLPLIGIGLGLILVIIGAVLALRKTSQPPQAPAE
ncbi:MAG: DUF3068 domain-containing protein [Anaerolineae bacterium]|nr:DUF3068 domain-containing protein [Anaerolineae bacterium]